MFLKKLIIIIFLTSQFLFAGWGKIVGTVKEKTRGKPIAEAIIELVDIEFKTETDHSGKFVIEDVPSGTYQLKASHKYFTTILIKDIVVGNGEEVVVNIWLKRKPSSDQTFHSGSTGRKKPPVSKKDYEVRSFRISGHKKEAEPAKTSDVPAEPQSMTEPESDESETTADKEDYKITKPKTSIHEDVLESESIEILEPSSEPSSPTDIKKKEAGRADLPPPKKKTAPAQSGLKAGFADDNKQYNYFLNFLENYKKSAPYYPININERIQILVKDKSGKAVPNAEVRIYANGKMIDDAKTYSDGSYFLYPLIHGYKGSQFKAYISFQQQKREVKINRHGPRQIEVNLKTERGEFSKIALDLLFILDTTGSMGEEIERLKSTIEIINLNLSSLKIKPLIRFGMVLYRDREDDYVTKVIPFTENLQAFQNELNKVDADGGGDTPEDLQSALKDAVKKMQWNNDGVRLAFIITDAPAHLDYDQKYTYADAAMDAKKEAIKIFSVGTGGLDIKGEYILRQISQFTYAKYIFLTYGEKGESEGGKRGSVSHHTGTNYQTGKLEAIIIRFAKEELANISDLPLEEGEAYFQAVKIDDEKKEETLRKLFSRAVNELQDYSSIAIPEGVPVSALPIVVKLKSLSNNAEYFSEQLIFAIGHNKKFKLIERNDMQFVAKEVGLHLSGLVEVDDAVKVGSFIGAEMLIIGNLYFKDSNYELFLKLVRVETAEILAVTKLKVDYKLGL
jgi:Mg-chelatase subunit ChlD